MKTNNSLPASLRGENYAIITQGNHTHIYPGELVQIPTLEEMKTLQTPGKVVTFLTPSSAMREAGREAIGNEPILAIVSDARKVQYFTKRKLQDILDLHGKNDFHIGEAVPSMSDDAYIEKVREIQGHIRDGDICQAVLARHFTSPIVGMDSDRTPLALLGRLLQIRGTYMTALFRGENTSYLYASPERHLTIKNDRAEINPIAGTMKIGDPGTFHKRLEDFALRDTKEAQELTMLLDEGTKMIAQFCPHGHIEGPFLRETGAVIHTEYRISGKVVPHTHVIDALRATLNAPTLTGSPINRACEIITRLEGITRGYYGGVFGVYRNHGNLDSAIAIRGIVLDHREKTITQSGGAGITLNSDPAKEAEETKSKIAGVRRVITSVLPNKTHLGIAEKYRLENRMRQERNKHLNSFLMRNQKTLEPSPELIGKKVTIINFDDNFAYILGVMIQSLGCEVCVVGYEEYEKQKQVFSGGDLPGMANRVTIGSSRIQKESCGTGERVLAPLNTFGTFGNKSTNNAEENFEDILVFGGGPGDINDMDDPKMNRLREIVADRGDTPLLGICLGCQAICQYLGIEVRKLETPLQGVQKDAIITPDGKIKKVAHYNSFAAFGFKKGCYIFTKPDGSIDMIHCPEKKMLGVQFHPESVMTEHGRDILNEVLLKLIK